MGKTQCRNGLDLKRGPWTPEEDQKLFAYIQKNGHRNWSTLPQKAGLRRCGKSCRIRWINYLRPDIKRGKFTPQEEQTIIQLHALIGNRWSIIAAFLKNRTDNEIKNYWNCRLKKKLAKMGIDPSTHRRKTPTIVGLSNTTDHEPSKNAAKIIHMAQWESTRLEAEARLVRKSKLENRPLNSLESEILSNLKAMPHLYARSLDFQPHEEVVVKPPCLDILKAWQIVAGACVSLDHDADSTFNNKPHEFSSTSFVDNDLRFAAVTSSGLPYKNFQGVTNGVTVFPAAAAMNESISNLQSFFPSGCISSTEDFGAANAAIFDNSDDIWGVDEPIDDMGSQLNSLDDFWDDLLPCDFSEEMVVKNEGFFRNGDHGGRAGDQELLGCSLSYCGRLGSLLMH